MRTYRTYDDAHWHTGGDYPADLPPENGATHIGMFLAWAIATGLASRMHDDRRSPLVRRLQARTITPGQYFLKRCYSKLRAEDFNARGNRFANAQYDDFLRDIESFFDDYESLYHVPDTWEVFDEYKDELDAMLESWERAGRTGERGHEATAVRVTAANCPTGGRRTVIQDEIRAIVSSLRPEDRDDIRALPEEGLIRLHRTLGRTLRNAFRSNTYPHLFRYCNEQETSQPRSFDSLSETAIRLVWEHLRQTPDVAEPGAAFDPALKAGTGE